MPSTGTRAAEPRRNVANGEHLQETGGSDGVYASFMTAGLPTGTVTFLFTDVEGSTRLWELHPAAMARALERHDEIMVSSIAERGGYVFSRAGDSFAAAFQSAAEALGAAQAAQAVLGAEPPADEVSLRVRMGLHTGETQERDGDYFGAVVNRAARLMAAGHGGQVLVSDTTRACVDVDGLVDLGMHRLKDVSEPVHVFQAGDARHPPLRTLDALGRGLGGYDAAMVGRSADLAEVLALVGDHWLVTLTGPGGVGKTRLAVEAALELVSDFPGGVRMVELAAATDRVSAISILAEAVDAVQLTGTSLEASLAQQLRGRRLLLLLDNCEHVGPEVADLVEFLGAQCSTVAFLCTSRERLGIPGERVFETRPLESVPDESHVSSAAEQLFWQRLEQRGASIGSDDQARQLVREICTSLDGLPLAVELAAGRVATLGLDEVATGLVSQLELLRERRSRRPERHRAVGDTVAWSYRLLEPAEQDLFDKVSVLVGWWHLDDIAAVADPSAASREVLEALVDKSMVQADVTAARARYRILEPVRQYGIDRLRETELLAAARDRHLDFHALAAEQIGRQVRTAEEPTGVASANRAIDNFRAAHHWAIESRNLDAAARLVAGLHDWAIWRERYELGAWAEAALSLRGATHHALAPILFATAGWARNKAGDWDEAIGCATNGLDAESQPNAVECGWLHDVLAHTAFFTGDIGEGDRNSRLEIERARTNGDPYRLAYVLGDNSAHQATALDPTRAPDLVPICEQALALAHQAGAPSVIGNALHTLGATLRYVDRARAVETLRQGITVAERVDAAFVVAACSFHLAQACADDPDEAVELLHETLHRLSTLTPHLFSISAAVAVAPINDVLGDEAAPDIAWLLGAVSTQPGPHDVAIDHTNNTLRLDLVDRFGDPIQQSYLRGTTAAHHDFVKTALTLLDAAHTALHLERDQRAPQGTTRTQTRGSAQH